MLIRSFRSVLAVFVALTVVLVACEPGPASSPTTALNSTSSTAPAGPSTTSTVGSTATSLQKPAGWTFVEIPFSMREGSAYATGGGWFFVWGGAPDRSGELRADGLLVDIDTGGWVDVPDAPIEGRYSSTAVWTGQEFVVFGGHLFDASFTDGAAFDPSSRTWRPISGAPLSAAAHPSSVWTGSEMVVWLAGNDSEFGRLPLMSVGQMAAYDPIVNTWRTMDAPQIQLVDATLFDTKDGLLLVGGPTTRDLGTAGPSASVKIIRIDPTTGRWDQAIDGPMAESVRPFTFANRYVGVVTDSGSVQVFDETEWRRTTQLSEDCWFDIGASSHDDTVFLKNCDTYKYEDGHITLILEQDEYGATANLYGSGFLTTDRGQLVTLTDLNSGEGTTGVAIFGKFENSK